jgi:hypothetical protein
MPGFGAKGSAHGPHLRRLGGGQKLAGTVKEFRAEAIQAFQNSGIVPARRSTSGPRTRSSSWC